MPDSLCLGIVTTMVNSPGINDKRIDQQIGAPEFACKFNRQGGTLPTAIYINISYQVGI